MMPPDAHNYVCITHWAAAAGPAGGAGRSLAPTFFMRFDIIDRLINETISMNIQLGTLLNT